MDNGQESPGKPPHGNVIVTPTRYVVFYTDGDRTYGASDAERAALWNTMTAYAGRYRFDDKTLPVSVDTSWNEVYNGTQQVRDVELRGKRMGSPAARRAPGGETPRIRFSCAWSGRGSNSRTSWGPGAVESRSTRGGAGESPVRTTSSDRAANTHPACRQAVRACDQKI